jgi:hypothetical protein
MASPQFLAFRASRTQATCDDDLYIWFKTATDPGAEMSQPSDKMPPQPSDYTTNIRSFKIGRYRAK